MLTLNRRGRTVAIAAVVFLLLLISLHSHVTPSRHIPQLTVQFASPPRCPSSPPNPAYARTNHDSFNWRTIPTKYPIADENLFSLPLKQSSSSSSASSSRTKIQFDFPPLTSESEAVRQQRQAAVKATFQRAWNSYEAHAWKMDELMPVTGGSKNTFGGWGATLADNLDTLIIMELYEEFDRAVSALLDIDFNPNSASQSTINIFETTIRYLGGFLAAYDLTGCADTRLLDKAIQIGDMIYASFDTPNRMPVTRWNPHKAAGGEEQFAASQGIIAELASSSLELTRLSQLTGDMRYFDAATRITNVLAEQAPNTNIPGLWPVGIDVRTPDLTLGTVFTYGGMADSAYEYLAKTYQLLGGEPSDPGEVSHARVYRKLYENAMMAGADNLLFRPMTHDHADILVPGTVTARPGQTPPQLTPQGDHLSCFVGGMYTLGGRLFANETFATVGKKVTEGCAWLYKNSPHGIMPEIFTMTACPSLNECQYDERQEGPFVSVRDKRYILRPEAIESVFYLYRVTGEEKLRETAWEMFQAIETSTATSFANAALRDVMSEGAPPMEDSMESFWMAETLKYFYLVFSEPDVVSLDEFVLNTEAHPFRVPK